MGRRTLPTAFDAGRLAFAGLSTRFDVAWLGGEGAVVDGFALPAFGAGRVCVAPCDVTARRVTEAGDGDGDPTGRRGLAVG